MNRTGKNGMGLKARNISFLPNQQNTDIFSYRNTEYADYLYMPIEQLQAINKDTMEKVERYFSLYKEWDRSEAYPDPAYNYLQISEKLVAVNEIIIYKVICRERFITSSYINWNHKGNVEKTINEIKNVINTNPNISYFELLDAFPDEEAELVIEYLIENNYLRNIV